MSFGSCCCWLLDTKNLTQWAADGRWVNGAAFLLIWHLTKTQNPNWPTRPYRQWMHCTSARHHAIVCGPQIFLFILFLCVCVFFFVLFSACTDTARQSFPNTIKFANWRISSAISFFLHISLEQKNKIDIDMLFTLPNLYFHRLQALNEISYILLAWFSIDKLVWLACPLKSLFGNVQETVGHDWRDAKPKVFVPQSTKYNLGRLHIELKWLSRIYLYADWAIWMRNIFNIWMVGTHGRKWHHQSSSFHRMNGIMEKSQIGMFSCAHEQYIFSQMKMCMSLDRLLCRQVIFGSSSHSYKHVHESVSLIRKEDHRFSASVALTAAICCQAFSPVIIWTYCAPNQCRLCHCNTLNYACNIHSIFSVPLIGYC